MSGGEPSDSDFFKDAIGGLGGQTPDDTITTIPERSGGEASQEPAPKVDERGRFHDERGRFAGSEQRQQPDQPRQGQDEGGEDKGGTEGIPSWRLREINAERRDAIERAENLARENDDFRRRLQQIEQRERAEQARRQPQPRPDPLREPELFHGDIDQRFEALRQEYREDVRREKVNMAFEAAHETHGREFEAAYMAARETVQQDPRLFESFVSANNPGKSLMAWWKKEKVIREVGDDPDGYVERRSAELLKDEKFREKALQEWGVSGGGGAQRRDGRTGSTVVQLPSVNQASGSSAGRDGARPGAMPVTDRDYFSDAVGGLPIARSQRARRGA